MRFLRKVIDGRWETIKLSKEEQKLMVAKTVKTNLNRFSKANIAVDVFLKDKENSKVLKNVSKEKLVELMYDSVKETLFTKTDDYIEAKIKKGDLKANDDND